MEQLQLIFLAQQAKELNKAFEVLLDERSKQIAENAAMQALKMMK